MNRYPLWKYLIIGIALLFAAEGASAHEGGEHAALVFAEAGALAFHDAGGEGFVDVLGGHLADGGGGRGALDGGIAVAAHAAGLESGEAGFGACGALGGAGWRGLG